MGEPDAAGPLVNSLLQTRCFHHGQREAVARCPECHRFFCRECIVEHEKRVLCSHCLQALLAPKVKKKRRVELWLMPLAGVAVFILGWFVFFTLGEILLRIPSDFHDGRIQPFVIEE